MNFKFGIFSVLALGIMMLLIPASSSLANAQEYDQYYEDEQYKKDNKSNEPVIIIKNEPIQKKEKKKMKELPMLIVKKDVLYCDEIADGTGLSCGEFFPGPDSDRYVQECTDDSLGCSIDESSFDMVIRDDIEFPGSEEGTKLNFNGERFTVTEDVNVGEIRQNEFVNSECQKVGFDGGFFLERLSICTLNEGECSGIVQTSELKECTVKNYVVEDGGL